MAVVSMNNRRFEVPEIEVRGNQATMRVPEATTAEPNNEGERPPGRSWHGLESRTFDISRRIYL